MKSKLVCESHRVVPFCHIVAYCGLGGGQSWRQHRHTEHNEMNINTSYGICLVVERWLPCMCPALLPLPRTPNICCHRDIISRVYRSSDAMLGGPRIRVHTWHTSPQALLYTSSFDIISSAHWITVMFLVTFFFCRSADLCRHWRGQQKSLNLCTTTMLLQ